MCGARWRFDDERKEGRDDRHDQDKASGHSRAENERVCVCVRYAHPVAEVRILQ